MTTFQIRGITLSAHAGANMAECFPADDAPRGSRRDRSRSHDAKRETMRRKSIRADKRAFLNS